MNKTRAMMAGVFASLVTLSACSSNNGYVMEENYDDENTMNGGKPFDEDCNDWEWDSETDSYYCDDNRSPHYGYYFLAGRYYKSKSLLKQALGKSSSSSSFKSGTSTPKSAPSSKSSSSSNSGLGSGSKGGFGG